ncbi:LuxQ periplasmic sensor domain-containing protein [Vibrio sp. WXL210]|uniref:LuxQ periplasmic sensor domain-containing protein n=1 Tax=Vibrio sp. WXL210 TaxID=3450709 RepID=UPI003EC6A214
MHSAKKTRRPLTTLITHSVFLMIAVFAALVLFQNYYVSTQIIGREADRASEQTSALIQSIFNYHLDALEIQQDTIGRSDSLISTIRGNRSGELDRLFAGLDNINSDMVPDIRIITRENQVYWNDGNHGFYGISDRSLQNLTENLTLGKHWYLVQTPSQLGTRYILMRRSPVLDSASGEVLAMLNVGVVLNNNLPLMLKLRDGSNSQDTMLAVGSTVIASSFSLNPEYDQLDILLEHSKSQNHYKLTSHLMVRKTDLILNDSATFLSIYTIRTAPTSSLLIRSHMIGIVGLFCILIGITIWGRRWLKQKIAIELERLMSYTSARVEQRDVKEYTGSAIIEFDRLGHVIESAFSRLSEQEKLFEDLFNFSLSPSIVWNANGQVVSMNPVAKQQFGSGIESTSTYAELVESLLPYVLKVVEGEAVVGINTVVEGNTYRWNISSISLENGTQQIIAQAQDISSLVEAERQTQRAKEAAEETARLRADFLAKMSHELRTPLNGIIGVSQLLHHGLSQEQHQKYVDILCQSGEHLLAVLNDILDFSKIEQGQFTIQPKVFKLLESCRAVEQIYSPLCVEKGVELHVRMNAAPDLRIVTDQVRLNQILFNLVSNAVKFTEHGSISVVVQVLNHDHMTIEVRDSGIGISESELEMIFEPFVQLESPQTRQHGGSGLGLSIVRSLVDLLGGTIDVKSTKGQGTDFILTIPIKIHSKHGGVTRLPHTPHKPINFDHQVTVLLVEDNATNAFIAQAFCEKFGLKVEWVDDGAKAIDAMKTREFDLVLMDNQLPEINGIDATKLIREQLKLTTPIFACTADGLDETRQAFLQAGANYVLIKPLKERALVDALKFFQQHYYQPA